MIFDGIGLLIDLKILQKILQAHKSESPWTSLQIVLKVIFLQYTHYCK